MTPFFFALNYKAMYVHIDYACLFHKYFVLKVLQLFKNVDLVNFYCKIP